jgi:hypothetical protein
VTYFEETTVKGLTQRNLASHLGVGLLLAWGPPLGSWLTVFEHIAARLAASA